MITMRRDNVVREVASEHAAQRLAAQGYKQVGGSAEPEQEVNLVIDVEELGRQIASQLRSGEPLTDETIAKALAMGGDAQPAGAAPAAKPPKGKGGKTAPKAGDTRDGN